MSTQRLPALAALLIVAACEDAGAIQQTNAIEKSPKSPSYTLPGKRTFDAMIEGDSTDRARFCDEAQATAQVAKMIEEPIIPDVSLGGVPLWGPDGDPVVADDLLGKPDEGKLCDPSGRYANAFAFGPLNEIIVLFNSETRLVEDIQVNTAYRGTLSGRVEHDGTTEEVMIRTRDKVRIGNRELSEYAASAQQANRPNSWLNHRNVTLIYGMIRQTFFEGEPLPADYDCVTERRCDVIYSSPNEDSPQQTWLVFQDSGLQLVISPEGQVLAIIGSPVRKAPFELSGVVTFGDGAVAPVLASGSLDGCAIELAADTTWGDFRSRCIDDDRELARANYDVHTQRDGVTVGFDGVTLDFMRRTSREPVFEDGEAPGDSDELFSITYTRSFPAASLQFIAADLAVDYAARLQQHLAQSLSPDAPPEHPFAALIIPVPEDLSTDPQSIGELEFAGETGVPESWVAWVVAAVQELHASLPEELKAMVDPDAVSEISLLNPFLSAVMSAFTFGQSDSPEAFTVFQRTDNRRWAFGISHFVQDGEAYRLLVQYNLQFGAVTAVTIERGTSEVDDVFSGVSAESVARGLTTSPYYDIRLASPRLTWNPYRLGGTGITVGEADHEDATVTVELAQMSGGVLSLEVPGTRTEDRGGYLRPLRGERFEFVPAHRVQLAGKETVQVFHVLPDGTIGRVQQNRFKAPVALCPGLPIGFGDDVRTSIDAWHALAGDAAYQNCELVFHHSTDGHVLTGVSSLANNVQFDTIAERATNVAIWD